MAGGFPGERRWLVPFGLIGVYLLLACSWMGIDLWDDTMYFYVATTLHPGNLFHHLDYAPLYCLWLKLLRHIFHDPVWCYMAAWTVLVVAVSSVALLFRNRLPWAYTLILFLLPFFEIANYVSHFAALFLVCGAALILRYRLSVSSAACVACAGCFLAAFARPEFIYGVFISAAIALLAIILYRSQERSATFVGKVLLLIALAGVMQFCRTRTSSQRSGLAFSQHVSVRAAQRGIIPLQDAWNSDYALRLFHIPAGEESFIPAATIGDFYKANPRLFLEHVLANLRDGRTIFALAVLLLVVLSAWFRPRDPTLRPAAIYLSVVSLPVVVSMLLIYPRPHYLVIVMPALLLIGLYLLPQSTEEFVPRPWIVLLVGASLLVLKVEYRKINLPEFNTVDHTMIATVRCIRDEEQSSGTGDGTLFDTVTTFFDDLYFRVPRTRILKAGFADWPSYRDGIIQARPAWIIQRDYAVDAEYRQEAGATDRFLAGELTYVPHPCSGSTGVVIYTRSLHPEAQSPKN